MILMEKKHPLMSKIFSVKKRDFLQKITGNIKTGKIWEYHIKWIAIEFQTIKCFLKSQLVDLKAGEKNKTFTV